MWVVAIGADSVLFSHSAEPIESDLVSASASQPGHMLVPVGLHQSPGVGTTPITVPTASTVAEVQQPMPVHM